MIKRIVVALALLLLAARAEAGTCPAYTFVFVNGQIIDAGQMNTNFNTVRNCFVTNGANNGANTDITSLSGVTLNGTTVNAGTLTGGTWGGTITNSATITGGTYEAATLTGNTFSGVNTFTGATNTFTGGTAVIMSGGLTVGTNPLIMSAAQFRGGVPVSIADAATVDLSGAAGNYVNITGSGTNITSWGALANGTCVTVRNLGGGITIKQNGNTNNITGADINSVLNDFMGICGLGGGVSIMAWYEPFNGVPLGSSTIANALSGDVALNNVATFFDGPSVAQGSVGTWLVTGTVTLQDTAGVGTFAVKLWDGTTTIASTFTENISGAVTTASLSGVLTTPAGNLRISVKDTASVNGKIIFNSTGLSKDSNIVAVRLN